MNKTRIPSDLSPDKAALHGMICSDGHFCMYAKGTGKPRGSYRIVLSEPNGLIRELFRKLVWKLYRVRARNKPRIGIIRAFGIEMMQDLARYGPYGKLRWAAPVLYLDRTAAAAWARSYFDGDGDVHVSPIVSKCKVRAKSVNLVGLESVRELLHSNFGIEARIYKRKKTNHNKWSQAYELEIFNRENLLKYARFVGFNHPDKRRKLRKVIRQINERN